MPHLCTPNDAIYGVIVTVFQVPTLILSLCLLGFYIAAYRKKALKTTKFLFYLGITFLLLITLHNTAEISQAATACHLAGVSGGFDLLRNVLYIIQASLLVVLLFLRLASIFNDTAFELSKRTIYAFVVLLIVGILMFIGLVALFFLPPEFAWDILPILVAVGFLDYVCGLICINYLFISKLMKVYESCKDSTTRESKMQYVATKNAILCIVSSSTIILTMAGIIFYVAAPGIVTGVAFNLVLQFDLVTNVLSVVLTYSHFDAWYSRLCGCCHRRCGACCLRCVRRQRKNQEMIEIEPEAEEEPESPESATQQEL